MFALDRRGDINLESYRLVAWEGEPVTLTDTARGRISAARSAFLGYVRANPDRRIYGANTRVGPGASTILAGDRLQQQTQRRPAAAGVSFGERLPSRVVRGILFARLANFVEGNSGVSLPVVGAVAAMLDGRPLPGVPGRGNGAAGEINALAHLFYEMTGASGTRSQGQQCTHQWLALRERSGGRHRFGGQTPSRPDHAGVRVGH